ncbi:MAG: 50S ribosomal protein L22 [Nitrospirae bacterium]|jgi:large subunit ribosomal protein L22|uniref:Large ribosomal subunit protein uL22 n=1 Tax=Leptospirillum ferrodiazotrophum TaxID=412449 RepID=C6HWG0_9BACT|nr:MAG: Ribosomal protein L22 [Leptospirillum ferrodiazotrophum]MCL5953764.1 50S ribosomal protein L22 [Nitrospirota bacterium]
MSTPGEAVAKNRFIKVSPRKVRFVIDAIRGMDVVKAQSYLTFTRRGPAPIVLKTLNSAVSNAQQKFLGESKDLKIEKIFVDQGPIMKRIQARAMGRAYSIKKRMSHLTIVLTRK